MEAAGYDECSNEELGEAICQLHALISATEAELFALLRVFAGREGFREDGCRGRRISGRPEPLREEVRRRLLGGEARAGSAPPAG